MRGRPVTDGDRRARRRRTRRAAALRSARRLARPTRRPCRAREHVEPVAIRGREIEVVNRGERRDAQAHAREQFELMAQVEMVGRFVEQQQFGLLSECAGQQRALLRRPTATRSAAHGARRGRRRAARIRRSGDRPPSPRRTAAGAACAPCRPVRRPSARNRPASPAAAPRCCATARGRMRQTSCASRHGPHRAAHNGTRSAAGSFFAAVARRPARRTRLRPRATSPNRAR